MPEPPPDVSCPQCLAARHERRLFASSDGDYHLFYCLACGHVWAARVTAANTMTDVSFCAEVKPF